MATNEEQRFGMDRYKLINFFYFLKYFVEANIRANTQNV